MATISPEQVRHVAKLARLTLSDEEVERFAAQLTAVTDHFAQLSEVDVEGVEPLAHPAATRDVLRKDETRECLSPEDALKNAPQRHQDFFKVPQVLDSGS